MISDAHPFSGSALRDGETDAWEQIYQAELPRVYNFLRYRLQDDDLAEECTAATFEKAWRHRGRYRQNQAAFSTWLFTIARNVATDAIRQRREEVRLDDRWPAAAPSPEAIVSRRQHLATLAALLADLSEREQEIISLKYGAELTNREIARQMGLTAVNVGIILYRTLRRLRAHWEELP